MIDREKSRIPPIIYGTDATYQILCFIRRDFIPISDIAWVKAPNNERITHNIPNNRLSITFRSYAVNFYNRKIHIY